MAAVLMSLVIFIVVFIFTVILTDTLVPRIVGSYKDWQSSRVSRVTNKLEDSFIFLEKRKVLLLSVGPFILGGIGFLLLHNILGLAVGFFLGLGLPGFLTKMARESRLRRFQAQLVDSLMILSSSLKAGLSLIQALDVLCEEMPAPISQEFGLVLKENRWGISLEESLRRLRERIPLEEVNLVVSSILVARETGGELTRVFSRLTETIRNSVKLKEKVATLTLQGRLQGVIMAILPVGFAFFIYKQTPDHFSIMWEVDIGRKLIALAVFLYLLGMYLIKRISTFRV